MKSYIMKDLAGLTRCEHNLLVQRVRLWSKCTFNATVICMFLFRNQVFIFAVYLENNIWGTMVMMPHPWFPGVPSSGILGIIFLVIFIISYFNSPTVMSSGADNSNNSSNPDTSMKFGKKDPHVILFQNQS